MRFSSGSHGRHDGLPPTRDRGCLTQAVIELTKSHTTSQLQPSLANMDGEMTGGEKKKSQSNLHKLNGQHKVEASLRPCPGRNKLTAGKGQGRHMRPDGTAPLKWQDQLPGGVGLLTRLQITVHRKRAREEMMGVEAPGPAKCLAQESHLQLLQLCVRQECFQQKIRHAEHVLFQCRLLMTLMRENW